MATELKRLTITIPENLEPMLDKVKQEHFYNDSQSEMIRQLIIAGLRARKEAEERKQAEPAFCRHSEG